MPGFFHMHYRFGRLLPVLLLFLTWVNYSALSQFPINPATNVPIADTTDSQTNPAIVSDGHGGAIMVWEDFRTGQGKDIFAQRINALGVVQWDTNGIAISAEAEIQDMPVVISDGAGGAIIAWEDKRAGLNYDIYAQRISASGTALWSAGGIPICAADGDQEAPSMVSDGAGGAIIAWNDSRPDTLSTIYAQRVDASGTPLWTMNGVPVLRAVLVSFFDRPALISDGNHGAIVGWDDWRNNETQGDIYVQRLGATGACLWDTAGLWVCLDPAAQQGTRLASDGASGAIVCWTDYRAQNKPNGVYGDDGIFAQHVDSAGIEWWTKDGVQICDTTEHQENAEIVADGSGGAFISWTDRRNGNDWDIFAQRIDSSGTLQWDSLGVPVCTAYDDQGLISMVSDSTGGVLIAWSDNRSGGFDVFGQRLSGKGISLWNPNGNAIVTASGLQALRGMIMSQSGEAILTWIDGRKLNEDVYAQNVNLDGYLGLSPTLALPKDSTVIGTDSIRLSWNPLLPKPSRYWLELGLDSTFSFRLSDSTITDTTTVVKNLSNAHSYWWKVRGVDNGYGPFSAVRKLTVGTGISGVPEGSDLPKVFALAQNFPNPFNPSTVISYQLPAASPVELVIFDLLGRQAATLVHEVQQAGRYSITWNASGKSSGVYFYKLKAGSFVDTKKLILLK